MLSHTRCTFKQRNTQHDMPLYSLKVRQRVSRVERHTHLYRTLPPALYPWRHTSTHMPNFYTELRLCTVFGVLDLLSFIFVIKQNIILILDLPNLFTKSISVFTRYLVSSIILCFLVCPGPLWIMIQPFFFFYIKLIFFCMNSHFRNNSLPVCGSKQYIVYICRAG